MKGRFITVIMLNIMLLWSCGNFSGKDMADSSNIIHQQPDGSYALQLEEAAFYNDDFNPSSNTAEWRVRISEPGRYQVWLSSATRDTTDLSYPNSVRISFLDNQLEADPACDKIIENSSDVTFPYFRADSYMGTFYFGEPGEYYIQVVSEKVVPFEALNQSQQLPDTKLISVILTPMTR